VSLIFYIIQPRRH